MSDAINALNFEHFFWHGRFGRNSMHLEAKACSRRSISRVSNRYVAKSGGVSGCMLATLGTHVDSCLRKPKILRLEIEFCAISSDREPSVL